MQLDETVRDSAATLKELIERGSRSLAAGDLAATVDVLRQLPDDSAVEAVEGLRTETTLRLVEQIDWLLNEPDTIAARPLISLLACLAPAAAQRARLHNVVTVEVIRAGNAGEVDRVAAIMEWLLEEGVTDGRLFIAASSILHHSRHVELAIAGYRRAIELGLPEAAHNLAMLAGNEFYREEVMDTFRRAAVTLTSPMLSRLFYYRGEFPAGRAMVRRCFAESDHGNPRSYLEATTNLLVSGVPDEALRFVDAAPDSIRTRPEMQFMRNLLDYICDRIARLPSLPGPARPENEVVCLAVCWGEEFINNFCAGTLRSLAGPGNLPGLARQRPVTLRIFTDVTGRMILRASPLMKQLAQSITIEAEIIPPALFEFMHSRTSIGTIYHLFGALFHVGMLEAGRRGQDVILISADNIYSENYLTGLNDCAAARPLAIMGSDFSACKSEVMALLNAGQAEAEPILVDSLTLVDHGFRYPHPRSRQAFVTRKSQLRTINLSYLYFPTSAGMRERRICPDVLYLARDLIANADNLSFLTSDGEMMDRLLRTPAAWPEVAWIEDTEQIASLELCMPEKNTGEDQIGRITPEMVASFAGSRNHFGFMRHCFTHEQRFRGNRPPPWPGDDALYTEFSSTLQQLLYPRWDAVLRATAR